MVMVVGVIILVVMFVGLGRVVKKKIEINSELKILEEEIGELESQNSRLQELVSYFETDSYQEKIARRELNLQKEGETAVAIPSTPADAQGYYEEEETESYFPEEIKSPHEKWWNYFFDNN